MPASKQGVLSVMISDTEIVWAIPEGRGHAGAGSVCCDAVMAWPGASFQESQRAIAEYSSRDGGRELSCLPHDSMKLTPHMSCAAYGLRQLSGRGTLQREITDLLTIWHMET